MDKDIDVDIGMKKGDIFKLLSDFENKLKENCRSKYVQYSIIASRSVNAAKKKVKRYLNADFSLYSRHWACVHGGRQFKSRGLGIRKTSTLRKPNLCPANIQIRISSSGNDYIVTEVNNKHNHAIIPQLFNRLPQNRKLPKDVKQNVQELLKMQANKHMLREKLETDLKKCINLKDLRNLAYRTNHGTNNMHCVCNEIQAKFGADCHLLIDNDDILRGLTFCTKQMIENMSAYYPEFICMDATYKLLSIKAPVYLILNEDGNGESSIVAVGVLLQEDKETLNWFLETFKTLNPSWCRVSSIMSDKDITERQVLNKCFPNAQLHICIFHVLKIFQCEITCDKLKINSSVRDGILRILQQLIYVSTEDEFFSILEKIKVTYPERVYKYLCDSWVDIRNEWCPLLGYKKLNFLNKTNNRLESINAKIKSVISKHSSLENFISNLFIALNTLEKEKNSRVADMLNKRRHCIYEPGQWQYEYFKYLSPYAFSKLEKQFSYSSVKILSSCNDLFITAEQNRQSETTFENCNCLFFGSMGLPCRHIFFIRAQNGVNLFDTALVLNRWTFSYFLEHCHFLHLNNDDSPPLSTNDNNVYIDRRTKNQNVPKGSQEKYRQLFFKAKLISTLGADLCGKNYICLKNLLDKIVECCQNNNLWVEDMLKCDSKCKNCYHLESRIAHNEVNNTVQFSEDNDVCSNSEGEFLDSNGEMDIEFVTISAEVHATNIFAVTSKIEVNSNVVGNSSNFPVGTPTNSDQDSLLPVDAISELVGNTNKLGDVISNSNNENDNRIPTAPELQNALHADSLETNGHVVNVLSSINVKENSLLAPFFLSSRDHNYCISEKKCDTENDPAVVNTSPCKNEATTLAANGVLEFNVQDIKVPQVKTRGRPAGSDLTVIGLPKKRRALDGPVPCARKKVSEKVDLMFRWFLRDFDVVKFKHIDIIDLLPTEDIDVRILEVNINILKKYFAKDAWDIFKNIKTYVKETAVWLCQKCNKTITTEPSIMCECCLNWYHIMCETTCETSYNTKCFVCFMCR